MGRLVFRGVAFAFGDARPIFEGVNLGLERGVLGVAGENGSGKTTLLRLAAGLLSPDRGTVRVEPAGALVVLCPQTVEALGDDVRALAASTEGAAFAVRDRLGLDPESIARWATLSPGERRRWQLAAALHREPDVLLVDEPTNHLDPEARARVTRGLASFRGLALVVSHDRTFLDAATQGTLRVHNGGVDVYILPYSQARAAWEREATARDDERRARKDDHAAALRKLAEARDQRAGADANRSSGRRMKNRNDHDARSMGAKFVVERAEHRLGRLVGARKSEALRAEEAIPAFEGDRAVGRSIFVGYEPAPRPHVLRLDADRVCAGDAPLLRDVHVTVDRTARIHVAGPNGAGKSTLVGALVRASQLPAERLLYLPQELEPSAGARLLADVRALPPEERGRTLSLVAALGVDPDRLLASRAPSPGEARKLSIALGLGRRVWALVLDEPTNHLDLPSIERLEAALAGYPGALVMVSHDDVLAERLTSERWVVSDGRLRSGPASSSRAAPSGSSPSRAHRRACAPAHVR